MARHEFALFVPQSFNAGATVTIQEPESLRRITSILRLREGEFVHLFNRTESLHGKVLAIGKRSLDVHVQERELIVPLKPSLTVLLPTLKKDDLEAALSSMCALGATTVQFVETEKVQHTWRFEREKDRFERVMIAAAEQSKQLALPTLRAPVSLEKACAELDAKVHKIFFDPEGQPLLTVMQNLAKSGGACALLVGPEGDLTDAEKAFIQKQGFVFCALTPTILRACDALALGAGVVRSLVR